MKLEELLPSIRATPSFRCTFNKGFQITFENGITISVQFGPGNYCQRMTSDLHLPETKSVWESQDAEIAVWDAKKRWWIFHDNTWGKSGADVENNCTPEQVAKYIDKFSKMRMPKDE